MIRFLGCALVTIALVSLHSICTGEAEWQPPSAEPINQLKKLYPQTILARATQRSAASQSSIRDRQPRCVVVTPEGAEYDALARRFVEILHQRTGCSPEVKRADDFVDSDWNVNYTPIGDNNLVALGNVNNNRLLAVLYGQRYVVEDSIYPGEGGYVIRTVHDPFAKGINVLVLAGSNAAGVEKAVSVFTEKYAKADGGNLILPQPIIDVQFEKKAYRFFPDAGDSLSSKRQPQYTGMDWFKQQLQQEGFMDATGKVIENRQPGKTLVSLVGMIARIGQTHFRTGNPELPPLMKELLDKNRHLLTVPEPLNEMGARAAWYVPEWDLLEELPVWTDQDRLDITNALLRDAAIGHERREFHKQAAEGAVMAMDENHGTCSALNSFVAWQYFHKYCPSPASAYWMRCAKAVFAAQASTYQIPEDAAGYLCYCPIQTMNYALRSGDLAYFKRGIARHHAQYIATACVNNLGLSTGFGDDGGLACPEFFEALAPAAWFHRDPELYWIVRNKLPTACGLRIFQNSIAFDLTVAPREPKEWTGLIRVPLYEAPLTKGNSSKTPIFAEKKDVDPKLFSKLVFRENWDENGQYLLLDGAGDFSTGLPGPHGHKHDDINTIINFTAQGRMWLVDHTYPVRGFQDHSGLYVLCNGVGGYRKGTLAELQGLVESKDYGLSRTRFGNWERAIFWRKGRYFLVVDTAIADKPGDYFARCSLRALGEADLRGTDLYLSQKGKYCKILSDGGANVDLERYAFTDSQWKTFYPYAKPSVRILQEDKARQLKAGERIGFINLLCAYGSKEDEERVRLQPVAENCAIVTVDGTETLLGIGEIPGGLGTANMFVLSKGVALLPGAGKDLAARPDLAEKALAAAREQMAKRQKAGEGPARQESKGLTTETVNIGMQITCMALADVDGDGKQEWIVGGEQGVAAFKPDGAKLWHFPTTRPVRCLDIADVDGDGRPEVAVGGDDEFVRLLDANGKERWSFQCKKSNDSISGPPAVDYVKIADLDGSGKKVVAGANWVHVLDTSAKLVWEKYMDFRRGRICGDFVAGDVADVNGDGKQEIIALFMTSYPLAIVYDSTGRIIMPADGPGDHGGLNIDVPFAVATADLFGGGKTRQIVCGCAGQIGFYWHDQKNKEQAGGAVKGAFVAMARHTSSADHPAMIFGADSMCGVVGIVPEPKRNDRWINAKTIWYRNLGEKVTTLIAPSGSGQVFAGTKKGSIYLLSAKDGTVCGYAKVSSGPVTTLAGDAGTGSVLAGTQDGSVVRVHLKGNQP